MSDEATTTPTPPADTINGENAEQNASIIAAAEDSKNPWAKNGALVVAGAPSRMPNKDGRMIVVAENRAPPKKDSTVTDDVKASYPKGADAYVGYATVAETEGAEARRVFPDAGDAEVLLLGDNVRQFSHEGLARKAGWLSVGPAHPVYAAVNLAWQRGARDVKVVGLRDDERKTLRPWFEAISPEFESLEYGG